MKTWMCTCKSLVYTKAKNCTKSNAYFKLLLERELNLLVLYPVIMDSSGSWLHSVWPQLLDNTSSSCVSGITIFFGWKEQKIFYIDQHLARHFVYWVSYNVKKVGKTHLLGKITGKHYIQKRIIISKNNLNIYSL